MGQTVPIRKDNLPQAGKIVPWHTRAMRDLLSPAQFEEMFIARVKALREAKGWTSREMATALDVPHERYRKYESRTPLPHSLMERFALITGVSVEFLITGRRVRGKGPYPDVPGPHDLDGMEST